MHISSLHQIVCARKDINTKPMLQYFLRTVWKKYFGMCTFGTKTTFPQLFVQGRRAQKKFLNKWENLANHSKFQQWFGKLEIFVTKLYTKNIENSFFVIFSATWLIRYVEKLHRIFTSSKPRLTGVNFPPRNKNWQCTAITTMQIKQKQAQLTPDRNSTNTICCPIDDENLHKPKIVATASN